MHGQEQAAVGLSKLAVADSNLAVIYAALPQRYQDQRCNPIIQKALKFCGLFLSHNYSLLRIMSLLYSQTVSGRYSGIEETGKLLSGQENLTNLHDFICDCACIVHIGNHGRQWLNARAHHMFVRSTLVMDRQRWN
jgi:hypothetical protein